MIDSLFCSFWPDANADARRKRKERYSCSLARFQSRSVFFPIEGEEEMNGVPFVPSLLRHIFFSFLFFSFLLSFLLSDVNEESFFIHSSIELCFFFSCYLSVCLSIDAPYISFVDSFYSYASTHRACSTKEDERREIFHCSTPGRMTSIETNRQGHFSFLLFSNR